MIVTNATPKIGKSLKNHDRQRHWLDMLHRKRKSDSIKFSFITIDLILIKFNLIS